MANLFKNLMTFSKKSYSNFDMSNHLVTDGFFGGLDPIYQEPVLAGDTWKISHNIMVKLPPLVSPAFTRIKGVVNSYYVSYASVWKYWNSFISDRPEDNYLNRLNAEKYSGKYIEPSLPMSIISFICKVAKGHLFAGSFNGDIYWFVTNQKLYNPYVVVENGLRSLTTSLFNVITIPLDDYYRNDDSTSDYPFAVIHENGSSKRLSAYLTEYLNTKFSPITGLTYEEVDIDSYHILDFPGQVGDDYHFSSYLDSSFLDRELNTVQYGFQNRFSFFIHLCQSAMRLFESFGLPTDLIADTSTSYYSEQYINALPYMCYSSIWQNYYRDNMLQGSELNYEEVNGRAQPNFVIDINKNISQAGEGFSWSIRLDSLPYNQKSVDFGNGYILRQNTPLYLYIKSHSVLLSVLTGFGLRKVVSDVVDSGLGSSNVLVLPEFYNGLCHMRYRNVPADYFTSAVVDPMQGRTSLSVPNTIDELRTVSKLEEFLERSAWARDFYNFMISHTGAKPESAKYGKPLLLGTQVVNINIGEQLQTSESTSTSALGERAGIAEGYGHNGTCDHYFNEHGHIISVMGFILDMEYFQGVNKHMLHHESYLDYPWPEFSNLGNEQIQNKEIYFGQYFSRYLDPLSGTLSVASHDDHADSNVVIHKNNTTDSDSITLDGAFGYTPRYSNWKHKRDELHGAFRHSLLYWNTFRKFTQIPMLSHNFISYEDIEYISNIDRIFAVESDEMERFYINIFNNASVRRWLPFVSNPTLD